MESTLKQLYYGKVYPAEQIRPSGEDYKSFNRQIMAHQEYLKQKLSPEDAGRLEEMERLAIQAVDIDVLAGFSHGLKLGFCLAMELFAAEEVDQH